MSDKNKVTVRIAGNEYVICGAESPEYIQKIALFVDRKLMEITRRNHMLSTTMASVLTAVNFADELYKHQEALGKSDHELSDIKKKYQELKEEANRLRADNARLKEMQANLQIELTKRETEIKEVRNTLDTLSNAKRPVND